MKDLNNIANQIVKNKNLEQNLPKFANSMMSLYNGLAYMKLSMNYYTYFDMLNDSEWKSNPDKEKILDLVHKLNEIIREEVMADGNVENSTANCEIIDGIRNEITEIVHVATAYIDRLRIFEYILNRVEYRFSEQEFDEEYYNYELTNELMHFIISEQDSFLVNTKISEVVGQLPVRISKKKFYSYISEAFGVYKGAQKSSVEDFIYSLRSTSMLEKPEHFDEHFSDIRSILKELAAAEYTTLSKEEYKILSDKLLVASQIMNEVVEHYMSLVELVNDVYTIILSKMYAFSNVEEIQNSKQVLNYILNKEIEGGNEEDIFTCFTSFEGRQEKVLAVVSQNEHALEYCMGNLKEFLEGTALFREYEALNVITKLQSGSDFVVLNDSDINMEPADLSFLEQRCEEYIKELDVLFSESQKIVTRAVMASVLGQLPVFFNNIQEIQEYINTSLINCNDIAEKTACIELMKLLMEDYQAGD